MSPRKGKLLFGLEMEKEINFVERMVFDQWRGLNCDEIEIDCPVFKDIADAIDCLNAENRTIVTIFGHLGAYLTIGGGAGQYVIYASLSDGDLWNVVSSDCPDSEELVMLNAGGQEGYFKSKYIVDRLSAISAASFFFSSGQLDDSLKWERQAEDC